VKGTLPYLIACGGTFRTLKEKEIKQFGEYRTRRLVLEAWDTMERRMIDRGKHGLFSSKRWRQIRNPLFGIFE
jgi:hypothetical protein